MFQHFIITRFNLKTSNFTEEQKGGVSEQWMDNRLQIFKDYCYNSVKNQKNQNFKWLVFFDTETSEKHIKIISSLAESYSNFIPIYIDGMDNFLPGIKYEIKKRLTEKHIITSRLDNDDCLHEEYVETLQEIYQSQPYLVIDFIKGLTLKINNEIKLGNRIHAYNPFISLIESTENGFDTIWQKRHGGWGKIKLIKQINNQKPLWLSVVHNENIFNDYIGFDSVDEKTLTSFNISPEIIARILRDREANSFFHSLKLKFIATCRYHLKRMRHNLRAIFNLIPDR